VLFIAVDDLRPELGCYGNRLVKSPALDKLAAGGVVFMNHYAQVPTCGASRCSMLTGMRPRTRAHLSNEAIRDLIAGRPEGERPETFIHHLRRQGYYTAGIGKISHYPDGLLYGYNGSPEGAKRELPHSWDELLFDPGKWGTGWNAFFGYADGSSRQRKNKMVKPYEGEAVADTSYPDGLTARLAVAKLKELAGKNQPFFLGVGFFKPHLPFTAPQKYWAMYDGANLPPTASPGLPEGVNPACLHHSGEFNQYLAGEAKSSLAQPVPDAYARKLRQAYLASVSYVDAQIGEVLAGLERLGLSENTIVVVWGDHGWHLGDHRVWGKHTLFEVALRSPLILKVPGMARQGFSCDRIVSSVDLYPTLMELCSVKMPHPTDGASLVPLLRNPGSKKWQDRAYAYYNSGITLRTGRYRITRYSREEEPVVELYDHRRDPHENHNLALQRPRIVRRLMPVLERGDNGLPGR